MDRPNTNYTYFYMFNFMPYAHEFSNWSVEGVDAEYEPDNWAKAINNTNFRKAFLYGINNAVTLAVSAPEATTLQAEHHHAPELLRHHCRCGLHPVRRPG